MAIWIIVLSVIGFIVMGIDKSRAIRHKWRIRERTLWILTIVGGGLGTFLGMMIWRHKIRKIHFVIGFAIFALIDGYFLLSAIYNFDTIHMKG